MAQKKDIPANEAQKAERAKGLKERDKIHEDRRQVLAETKAAEEKVAK